MQSTPFNSYDSVIKKLQKIYQMQTENKLSIDQATNESIKILLDANWFKGSIPVADSKNISITPIVNTQLTTDSPGIPTPIDVNYLYTNAFTIPSQFLGFLGFELYFNPSNTDTLSPGSIWQGQVWTPDIYEIIADGTTVWSGPNPPTSYMSVLDYATAQNALYTAPAWNVTIPNNSIPSAPPAGIYRVLGFLAFENISHITPNNSGSYWAGEEFLAMSVTDISGGNFTANGMLLTNTAKTQKQILIDMPSGGVVPAFATSGFWPAPWQNPNLLGPPWGSSSFYGAGIPAIPGQFCLYTGGFWDGTAIYQAYNPQFIFADALFEGITFEAQMPSPYDFATAIQALGYSSGDSSGDSGYGHQAWWQLYAKFGNDLGGGATNGPGHGKGATITNAFNNGDWGSVRMPGDMGLTGIPVDALQVIFNLMWTNYTAGTHPSWLFSGGGSSTQMYPEARFTYGVQKTYSLANMRLMFLNSSQVPGGEVSFPGGDQTIWTLTSDANAQNIRPIPFGTGPYLSAMWASLLSSTNTSASITVDAITPSSPGSSTGAILSASLTTRGANYIPANALALTPGGATFNVFCESASPLPLSIGFNIHSGSLTSVSIDPSQGGFGYAVGDLLTIIGGSGKGGTATVASLQATTQAQVAITAGLAATVNITAVNNGVTVVSLVTGGSGYFVGATIAIKQGGYSDATVTVGSISAGGVITGLVLTTPGTDYVTANNVPLATAGVISAVTLLNGGTGYGAGQILPVVQSGGNGGYIAVISVAGNGIITSLAVAAGGLGYTTVTETSPLNLPISGTIASVSLGSVGSGYNTSEGQVVNPGMVTAAVLVSGGTGYAVGQTVPITQIINLKYTKAGIQAFYDSTLTTQLYVQNIASNPNVGRPDQHQQLAGYLALGQSLYDQPGFNTACANYYFPYKTIELLVNPSPYPEKIQLNTAVLDNTFDPVFVRLSKSTDDKEKWGVYYYASCILMSPSVYQSTKVVKQWDDVTLFYQLVNTQGYISMAQEGLPPYDIGAPTSDPTYQNRSGPVELTSGPDLYSDVTPNTTSHLSTDVIIYYPQANPVTLRVKTSLKTPSNWSQVQKFNLQKGFQ